VSEKGVKVSGKKVVLGEESAAGWKFESRAGGWIIATGPDGLRQRIAAVESRGRLSASIGGNLFSGEILRSERGSSGAGGGDSDLTAQFPGKVRKIVAAAGATLKEGDPILMVEAMKMEFVIKAPSAGLLKAILVKEEEQLSPGKLLVDFVPEAVGKTGAAEKK